MNLSKKTPPHLEKATKAMAKKEGEFRLISETFAPLAAGYSGSLSLRDDGAILTMQKGREVVVTSDTLVEGVHFLPEDPPHSVGIKTLAVNLSDLAAMGAEPHAYTLSAAWSPHISTSWIESFAAALKKLQERYHLHLIGGDTVSTPGPLTLTITAFGLVHIGKSIQRKTANIGDNVYVTGNIGDSALGLQLTTNQIDVDLPCHCKAFLVNRYRQPIPRVEIGNSLYKFATSAVDISDGLVADIKHIAEQSDRRIIIYTSRLPLSEAADTLVKAHPKLMNIILEGGDDYELAFTAPPKFHDEIIHLSIKLRIPITAIGNVMAKKAQPADVEVRGDNNQKIQVASGGYRHF